MPEEEILASCEICAESFQFGPHVYDGRVIESYKLTVCNGCFDANWDGWGRHHEERLLSHLKAHGIEIPKRNAKGYLPRGD